MSVRCLCGLALLSLLACQRDKNETASGTLDTRLGKALSDTAIEGAEGLEGNACKGMRACTYDGQCTLVKGRCRASADGDCQSSLSCIDWGTCHHKDGQCVARDDKLCQKAWTCLNMGRCTARDDKCVVDDDGDCGRSELCKVERKCKADQGRCIRSG